MGVHLNGWLEKDGRKIDGSEHIVDFQNYAVFGFWANVRNYSKVPSLTLDPRSHYCERREEHIDVLKTSQLLEFDYDQAVEDRRKGMRDPCPAGEGVMTTYREMFGEEYFSMLEKIRASGADTLYFVIE